ncbi:glycerol-3-phosphate acyltransferase [Sporosarcina thermotolerans]|uniref:Glycerol-3-phosphate acyltransferase n=1 Tax=Sporosarcina thermotolerans TaxID=633404 RepID=A0AAW9AB29_9BACL|nr:glycerol-3-phosphate acyltransferase [Sporosarcina thermotolerans]MDW0118244.1 glycerol-3-phosphate acyltransferase [Sporosarcina thermotolerans]
MTLWIISIVVLGYIVGCLHGSTIARWISGVNLKETGVKNAGASNAMIVLGKKYGALVALVDIGKGVLAVIIVRLLAEHFGLPADQITLLLFIAGAAVIFGHNFPFHMKFNGGKGTATVIGVLFAIDWWFGLAGLLLFILVALATDILVFGVIMLYITLLAMAIWLDGYWPILISLLLFLIAIWKHFENFRRIRNRTEPRIRASFKK